MNYKNYFLILSLILVILNCEFPLGENEFLVCDEIDSEPDGPIFRSR